MNFELRINRILLPAIALLALSSCKDNVSLEGLDNKQELVVYCFPSTADTTYISVSKSLPVRQYNDNIKLVDIDDATITYNVNGQPQTVVNAGKGKYYVLARQKGGDNITVSVSAEGLPDASGETTIPDSIVVSNLQMKDVSLYSDIDESAKEYHQLSAEFTDPQSSNDYYGVRVRAKVKRQDSEDEQDVDTLYFYPKLYTQSEPLLYTVSKVDDDFGFSDNLYGGIGIFDDTSIRGQRYRIHLNVDPWDVGPIYYEYSAEYRIELLHMTPEFYRFLQSVNSVQNSDLAQHGFSQIMPTISNVHGGFGVVAGWNVAQTEWIED